MKDDSKNKDDIRPTPLESLFQDQDAVTESMVEAADAADTKKLAAAQPIDSAEDRKIAQDAEMIGLVQEAADAGDEAAPDAAPAAEGLGRAGLMAEPPSSAQAAGRPAGGANASEEPEKPYEELVRELEQIVRRLESGDISLDQSMALFARGIELTRRCQSQLDAIEKKITILIENPDGSVTERPFAENPNE